MADIKTDAKYVLSNALIGSTHALASTSTNDSVVVVQSSESDASQSWYFVETSTSGYYRLHTQQKGDYAALDVYNYNGKNSIDLHLYAIGENTGQYWNLNKQDDGSVKISNQFTGPDIYLDVVKDTLQPTLAAKDGPGQRWTL
ncbi:carbohydrate-binding module family 13 protein, partial [Setomelanomma holmii]